MSYHVYKNATQLAWLDRRDQINLDGRKLLRRVLNEALEQANREFTQEVNTGRVLSDEYGVERLRGLLLRAAEHELGSGDERV